MSNDGHCPYLHSWKIDSPETVDPIYQHWVPIVADWSIRPLYRGWYLLWLTIIDNGWQCNAFAGHLCRSFGSEKILELWVKIERFFKRAMVPFFCCNSATINAWSKSKCSACFIFVVTWPNFICWFTWQLRRLGESRLHCLNRSTLWAKDPCASLLLNFVYSTADNALHILMTDALWLFTTQRGTKNVLIMKAVSSTQGVGTELPAWPSPSYALPPPMASYRSWWWWSR